MALATESSAQSPASQPQSAPVGTPGEDFVQPARHWTILEGVEPLVQCDLCPNRCIIPERERGYCGVRECRDGRLVTLVYGRACHARVGRVEDHGLWHFLPGEKTLSLAAAGCNMDCRGCNQWRMSQSPPELLESISAMPEEIPAVCEAAATGIVAFGVAEPVVAHEWLLEALKHARQAGLKTILETNGHIEPAPLEELLPHISGAKVDLKSFSPGAMTSAQRTMVALKQAGVWLEVSWLIHPSQPPGQETVAQAVRWMLEALGAEVPLHFLRFEGNYREEHLPQTPRRELTLLRNTAAREGLKFAYISGVEDHEAANTYCPDCLAPVVVRSARRHESIISDGKCPLCSARIAGTWKNPTVKDLTTSHDDFV